MSCEPIISLRNVSKTYRTYAHPFHGFINRLTTGKMGRYKEFRALNDISLDIYKGETVGIIGRNGSGKSTLLQLICGVRQPSSGDITVKGRLSALLELGSGFHQEYTGRENVFLQGAIMGLSRQEMEARLDDIAKFAEIGEYLDQPIKTYSSGMFVRLAFAVAIHVDPEILVIDEALSVGDYAFQSKCIAFLRQFREQGGTMIFVSHEINTIKALCDKGIWVKKGEKCYLGPMETVVQAYLHDLRSIGCSSVINNRHPHPYAVNAESSRQSTGEARIIKVELWDEKGHRLTEAQFGTRLTVRLDVQFHAPCEVLVAYYICDETNRILGSSTLLEGVGLLSGTAGDKKLVEFLTELPLAEGAYFVQAQLTMPIIPNVSSQLVDYLDNAASFLMKQRSSVKIWSQTYVKNVISVSESE